MTTFEKALAGDRRSIDRIFFNSKGDCRSDEESRIIFNMSLPVEERLRRIAVLREARSFVKPAHKAERSVAHVPFGALISSADMIHAHSLGVQLD